MRHLIVPLFLVLGACAKDDSACRDPQTGHGPTRLVTFGDSQTAGHATETTRNCGYSWANVLSKRLGMELSNTAVAGSRFTDDVQVGMLMRYEFRATDTVILLIGFNDMRNFGTDPGHLAQFETELQAALLRVSPLVDRIVIGTCLTPLSYDLGSPAARDAYRSAVRNVVNASGLGNVTVLDVGDSINQDPAYFVDDGLHLNLSGQDVVANDFQGVL